MLRIWGRISSINVRKVVLCAQVLELGFERIDAGMQFGIVNTTPYKEKNPNAMVPLLEDGDFTLWESNVIVCYLCASHGPPTQRWYPADLRQRFNAERWMDWQQTELNRASGPAFRQWIRTAPEHRDPQVIATSVAATEPLFQLLDSHLAAQPYLAGEHWSMADIPVACEVHRWWGLPQPRPAWPNLERWYAQWLAHPASRGVLDLPLS